MASRPVDTNSAVRSRSADLIVVIRSGFELDVGRVRDVGLDRRDSGLQAYGSTVQLEVERLVAPTRRRSLGAISTSFGTFEALMSMDDDPKSLAAQELDQGIREMSADIEALFSDLTRELDCARKKRDTRAESVAVGRFAEKLFSVIQT
jgi:hypothetical protein